MVSKTMKISTFICLVLIILFSNVNVAVAADPEITKLVLSKNEVSLETGEDIALTATAVFDTGSTSNVTIKSNWNSSNPDVATVNAGTVTAKKPGTTVITATFQGKAINANITVNKKVKALTTDVNDFDLRIGKQLQVELTAVYEDGTSENVTKKANWYVDNYSVATVINGLVTGKKSGVAKITSQYGNQSLITEVKVELARRLDTPSHEINLLVNEQQQIELIATYPDGTSENVSEKAEWESDNEKVADVIKGVIKAYSAGTVTIKATYGMKSTTIKVEVDASRKLEVNEQQLFMRVNDSEQLELTLTYIDGKTAIITDKAKWKSSDEAIASVVNGEIHALKAGSATITAAYGSKSVTIVVDVEVPKRLDLEFDSFDLELDKSRDLKLIATLADGQKELITEKASWKSDNSSIADVFKGKVTGYKSGTTTITASYGGKQAQVTVRVNVPTQIVLSKTTVDTQIGEVVNVVANANYRENRVVMITNDAEWTSSNPDVAEVNKGEIRALKNGTSTITVSYGTRSTTLVVSVGVVEQLTPLQKKLTLRKNEITDVSLLAKYKGGLTKDITSLAEWSSNKPDIASVFQGIVTANSTGNAILTAKFGGESITIAVEVDVSTKLVADTYNVSLEINENKPIVLISTDSSGKQTDVTSDAVWSSKSNAIADVNNGMITALSYGKTTITAKFGGQSVNITVNVGAIQKLEASNDVFILHSGTSQMVKLTATLPDGRTKDVTSLAEWQSSNSKVASVSQGRITAIGYGKTKVTAKYNGKTVTLNIEVDVLKYLDIYRNDKPLVQLSLKAGQSVTVEGLATYYDNSERSVTYDGLWSSAKPAVAHVKHGVVTAQGKGKTTISLKFGNKTTKMQVTVE